MLLFPKKKSKEDTFSAIGCNCSNAFDHFFHDKRIHYHRGTKLKNTLWGWVDADWDGDREDEGQLPLHHRDKDTGDHVPIIFVDFPVLECEWTEYSNINTRSCREGVEVYFLTSVRQICPWFVYEIEIKWSLERDKFTHKEISTHTWTSVVNVVKGS
jgi:hypothetical protein